MNKKVAKLINEFVGVSCTEVDISTKTPIMDKDINEEPYYWRNHLLEIFSTRLDWAIKKNGPQHLISQLDHFVTKLESLSQEETLYLWKCYSNSGFWIGWATESEILYAKKIET